MIEICGVTRTYASTRALDGVSFCVPDGAVTGFVGPNGAGKSTLMRVATGLELPDSVPSWSMAPHWADDRRDR